MVWKDCLPIFSVIATVLLILPTIGEAIQEENLWKCHQCRPGTFVAQECSAESGTRCAPCPAGTFTDHFHRLFQCKPCRACPAGQIEQVACNREHDTTCIADDGSGELPKENENKFSNTFSEKNIPQLTKVEEEPAQEELSGDTPIKPHLFDMDSFEPRNVKTIKPLRDPTEGATVATVQVSDGITTSHLPENEAAIDDLIPIQKVEAKLTTTTIDAEVDGSGTSTLAVLEFPEVTTKTVVQPEVTVSEEPQTSSKPEMESTTVVVKVPEVQTRTVVDTFHEIPEPVKPSAETETITSFEPASTTAAKIEVTTPVVEVAQTTKQSVIFSEVESEKSSQVIDTTRSPVVTIAATAITPGPDVDTSTLTESFIATTVLLKKIIAPMGDTIDKDQAMRNKTPIAEIIPLLSTTPKTDEDSDEHSQTTIVESTSKESEDITSAIPTDITTPEQSHPWINGSELQQEPAIDNAESEDNKHLDVAIAAVITGIGLVVLAIIAVRYCWKKRTFKDMRRAQEDQMRIQMNEEKQLKRKDSQTDDSFQTAIYDDIELQAVNGEAKHLNGKANGHCKDSNGTTSKNGIMSAVNCNYKPADATSKTTDKTPVETVYAVPNKLIRSEPTEPLLNGKSHTTEKGETTTTPGFRLDILDNIRYIDETTDEEGEYVPTRMYLRQACDDMYSSAEDPLLQGDNNLNAIAEESTPMLRRLSDDQS